MANQSNQIAIFSLAYEPFFGGAEIAVKEITKRLPYSFNCFTWRFDKSWASFKQSGNVQIARLGKGRSNGNYYGRFFEKLAYVFAAFRAASRAHKKKPFRAIWGVMASYGGLAALLFKLRHPKVPFLLTLQEGDSEEHILKRVGIFYPLWKLIFKKADYIQVISNYLADFAKRHGARCPIEVVPNGVDIEKFEIRNSKLETNSKLQNINIKTIITTSRLVYKNGVDILIRAGAELAKIHDSRFMIRVVGDGPERGKLESLVKELGLGEQVKFLGQVTPERIPEYLSQADIFARASRSEGLGSSFLEAMAAGLPVIGTPVGGITDFLKDKETGLLVQVDDAADLAGKIALLFNDRLLKKRLAESGRELVLANYSWDLIAGKMENIFSYFRKNFVFGSRTKVLIATGIFPPAIGGPATYSKILAEELPKHNFQVSVLSFGAVRRLPKIFRHSAYFFKVLRASRQTDVVFAQDPVSVGLPAALAAKILGKRFILKIVGDYAWEQGVQRFGISDLLDDFLEKKYGWQVEFLRRIQKFTARQAEKVIVPSQYLKSVVAAWGISREKIVVIANAYESAEVPKENFKAAASQNQVIFSAGRLVPWKGFDGLIEVMPAILKDFPRARLVIAGDGPEKENLKSQISRQRRGSPRAANLKLEGKAVLLGALTKEELSREFGKASLFVLNTGYEGFSHQILEAMAAGVPVVTTRVGGNPELVTDKENGLLVDFNDKKGLLRAIFSILKDKQLADRLAKNAKAKAGEFSLERMVSKTAEILSL